MSNPSSKPRISANELAQYMISSETTKMAIIRRNMNPQPFVTSRYSTVRRVVRSFLTDPLRDVNPLNAAEQKFQQQAADPSQSTLMQDDARQSIEVLHSLQAMGNKLGAIKFSEAPQSQPKLTISGVEVSVRADLYAHKTVRGKGKIGGAILRLIQDDSETPAAIQKRKDMGLYTAALMRMHLDQNLQTNDVISNDLCMSIDIRHGEVFAARSSNTRRINDITNACIVIASLWNNI